MIKKIKEQCTLLKYAISSIYKADPYLIPTILFACIVTFVCVACISFGVSHILFTTR